jgi:AcrR family transcriptional regulator
MGRHRQFDKGEALQAALSLFWKKGYEGTSFEDLTRATGVARPGLYSAFGNKEALFLKALDLYDNMYMGFLAEALRESRSARVVETILRGSVEVQTMNADHPGCLGINGAMACSDDAESVRREINRRRAGTQLAVRLRLERAQCDGDLLASLDCSVLAAFVMAVSQGMAVQAKAGSSKEDLEGVVEYVVGMWPTAPC